MMKTSVLATDRRRCPSIVIRIIALIQVMVVMLSTGSLIIGNWYQSTILSVDWYRPVIKNQAFQSAVRDSIMNEISKEIGQPDFFASILTQALEQVLTTDHIEAFLDKYLVSFVDYLNGRSASPLPADAAEMFSHSFLSYVHEVSQKQGVPLPAYVEQQIVQMAALIGEIAENNIDSFTRESFRQLAALEKYHQFLLWISQSMGEMILFLVVGLLILLLLFLKQLYRFFIHAFSGIWLAGAMIGLPLLAVNISYLDRYLIEMPATIKPVIKGILTSAADHLKMISLPILAGATVILLFLFVVRSILQDKAR